MRADHAVLGEVRLHYVEAGEGPLVVLLHGFPEFWYGWRSQIDGLAAAGLRVVAPDMRGYNLSSKPAGVAAYGLDRLARDVRELIAERGAQRACVAGHDWGGAVAWWTAMRHPEAVERLAILNAPHPRRFLAATRRPEQLARSWYFGMFGLPWLPERLVRAGRWRALRRALERDARPGAFTPADLERYVEAWEQPGAIGAMLGYYRAALRRPPGATLAGLRPVDAPTRVIWGERDRYLAAALAEPPRDEVPRLERVIRLPEASHWVQHDEPGRVTALLAEFFGAA
jgi:pimeloyl-ACP methyl ester carboxylesterase